MFFGLYETKAEKVQKELERLKADVSAKEAIEGTKEVTFKDLRVVTMKFGKNTLAQAEVAGSELLTKVKTAGIEEKFNEKSVKIIETVLSVSNIFSKKFADLKNKAADNLKP
jgi:hypothetical protein